MFDEQGTCKGSILLKPSEVVKNIKSRAHLLGWSSKNWRGSLSFSGASLQRVQLNGSSVGNERQAQSTHTNSLKKIGCGDSSVTFCRLQSDFDTYQPDASSYDKPPKEYHEGVRVDERTHRLVHNRQSASCICRNCLKDRVPIRIEC